MNLWNSAGEPERRYVFLAIRGLDPRLRLILNPNYWIDPNGNSRTGGSTAYALTFRRNPEVGLNQRISRFTRPIVPPRHTHQCADRCCLDSDGKEDLGGT